MRQLRLTILLLVGVVLGACFASAQIFVSPHIGFKSISLEGAIVNSAGGTIQSLGVGDAGKTAFEFGATVGMPLFQAGVYSLDAALDVSISSAGLFEAGYNASFGSGKFAADGLSGLTTALIAVDLMPIHRFTIPNFDLITPYGGVGLSLNFFSNSDLTVGPPTSTPSWTAKAAGNTKLGVNIFYGAVGNFGALHPFLQLKHMIPFGSEFQFTDDPTNGSILTMKDSPGYFNISAGLRFEF